MLGKKRKTDYRKSDFKDVNKEEVNRKLIIVVFLLTGIISAVLWIKGHWSEVERSEIVSPVKKNNSEITPTRKINQRSTSETRLIGSLRDMVASESGQYGVYIYEITNKHGFGFNENIQMPGASILKVPVMAAALNLVERGELSLDQTYDVREGDRSPGSGPVVYMKAGTMLSLDKLLGYMGKNSDNTAWMMLNRILGDEKIELAMKNLGMEDSSYKKRTITAKDTASMFEAIYRGDFVGDGGKDKLFEYLTDSIYEDRISAGIKADNVLIVHKVGTLDNTWSDAGIVMCKEDSECDFEPFVLVIINDGVSLGRAGEIVPQIAKKVWEFERSRPEF